MESLDVGVCLFKMTTTDATKNLINKIKCALFGRKIREREARIGLDDANSREFREVETFGDSLGADNDIDFAGFNVFIEGIESFVFLVVAVKAGDIGSLKEAFQFGFEEFRPEAFMDDFGVFALWAGDGDFLFMSTGVTEELIRVSVES